MRRHPRPEQRWRDTEDLPAILADKISDLIDSHAAEPTVIVLQSRPGRGKTYVVQRLFDILAERDATGFWRPGLTPTSLPTDEEALRESRKRVSDPRLQNLAKRPNWFWFGLSAGHGHAAQIFGDPALSSLLWQVQSAVRLLRARRHATALARAAGIVSSGALEIASEKYSQLKTGLKVAKELLELYSTDFVTVTEIDDDLITEIQSGLRKALDELTAFLCTSIVVLDDAHLAHSHVLRSLAGVLVEGGRLRDQSQLYFDAAAPAANRRLLVVATAWSRFHSDGFWRWFDEAQRTGVRCLTFREESGWFGGIPSDTAATLLRGNLLSGISTHTVERIVNKGSIDGRIAPILLARYAVETIEREFRDDDDADEFIASLPVTIEEIAAQRFAMLAKEAREAALLAGALGFQFPRRLLRRTLMARLTANAEATDGVIDSLVKVRYLVPADSEEWPPIQGYRFADELDFGFVRNRCRRYRWVNGVIHRGIEDWFGELIDYLSSDLQIDNPWIPLADIISSARVPALEYLSRRGATSGSIEILCKAIVSPLEFSAEREHELPNNFAELWAWSLRRMANRDRPIPLEILRLTKEIASCSRVTATIALWAEARRNLLSQEQDAIAIELLRRTTSFSTSALRLAEIYIEDGQGMDAKNVLAENAYKSDAAIRLAELYVEDEQREDAKRVLAAVADKADAALKLAELYVADGQRREAEAVLKTFPNRSDAAMRLAELRIEDAQRDEAKSALLGVAHSPDVVQRLAELYVEDGQREDAKNLLAAFTANQHVAMKLAKLYLEDGQRNEAKTILKAFANDRQAAVKLAVLYMEDGQRNEAKAILKGVANEGQAAVKLAALYVEDGQRDEAKAVLSAVASESHAAMKLAKLYVEDGQRNEAKMVLKAVSYEGQAAIKLATLYMEDDEREEAKAVLVAAAYESQAAITLAKLYVEDGQRGDAKAVLKRMPKDSQAAVELAELYIEEGNKDEAKKILEKVKRESGAAIRLALILGNDGDYANAISVLGAHTDKNAGAALMVARYALQPETLAVAQNAVDAHLRRGRWFVFAKLTEHCCSADDVLRAIPIASHFLKAYWSYLYEHGLTDPHAAGLYALLTARCFPAEMDSALRLARTFTPSDPFSACAMAELQLSPADSEFLGEALRYHALAGHRDAIYRLAELAAKTADHDTQRVALALMRQQREFTDAERQLFFSLAGLNISFRKMYERPDPRGPIQIWELEPSPE